MKQTFRYRPGLATLGPYILVIMAAVNVVSVFIWMALLTHSIPPHTPVPGTAQLFVAAFPGIIVLIMLDSICLGLWMEYITHDRGDSLRRQIVEDRAQRDTAIAEAVAQHLQAHLDSARAASSAARYDAGEKSQ